MPRRLIVVALVSMLGIAACGGGDPDGVATSSRYLLRRDGAAGNCLTGDASAPRLVDCGIEHTIEVIGTYDYPVEMMYPGSDGVAPLQFFADCDAGFADYVGVAPDRSVVVPDHLRSTPVIPSEDSWNMGDHRVVCTVRSDVPWSGSVRGIGGLHPARPAPTQLAVG